LKLAVLDQPASIDELRKLAFVVGGQAADADQANGLHDRYPHERVYPASVSHLSGQLPEWVGFNRIGIVNWYSGSMAKPALRFGSGNV
jgi:hypothetical protein